MVSLIRPKQRFATDFLLCVGRPLLAQFSAKNPLKMPRNQNQNNQNNRARPNRQPRQPRQQPQQQQQQNQNFERDLVREQNLNENIEQMRLNVAIDAVEAQNQHEQVQREEDDAMLDGENDAATLNGLTKQELVEKVLKLKKARNQATRKTRSKTRTNNANVKNLSTKLLASEREKKVLKDRIEYLYNLCRENNIEVNLQEYNDKIKKKQQDRDFISQNLY